MQYAPLVTIAPTVKDLFVLVPQDIREMLSPIVSGYVHGKCNYLINAYFITVFIHSRVNVKATVSVLIIRHVLTTNVLIPAAVNVEQVFQELQKA